MADWERIILGLGALLFAFFCLKGIGPVIEESRKAENKDWGSVIFILGIVVAFVVALVMFSKS